MVSINPLDAEPSEKNQNSRPLFLIEDKHVYIQLIRNTLSHYGV